jgi:hypothetical protein
MDTDVNAPRYGIGGQSAAGRVEEDQARSSWSYPLSASSYSLD